MKHIAVYAAFALSVRRVGEGVPDEQHVVISVPLWSGALHCRHHAHAASHLLLGRSDGNHGRQGRAIDKNRSCQGVGGFSKGCCSNPDPAETYQEAPRPNAERCRCDRLSQADAEEQSKPVRAGGIENSRQVEPQGTCSQASQLWQISMGILPLPLAPCCDTLTPGLLPHLRWTNIPTGGEKSRSLAM